MAGDEDDVLDALERTAKEYDKDFEIDRILSAFQLDAYAVLDLQPGVAESDIQRTYRSKSLLIHPDKTRNKSAPEAFDRLKKAQTALLDDKQRAHLDEATADARMLLLRERKWTVDHPDLQTAAFRRDWRKKTVEVLVDAEERRQRQIRAQLREEGRAQRKEDEEAAERKRKWQEEKDWEDTREGRVDSWRNFKRRAGGGGGGGGAGGSKGGEGDGAAAGKAVPAGKHENGDASPDAAAPPPPPPKKVKKIKKVKLQTLG